MGMRALPLSSSNNYCCPPSLGVSQNVGNRLPCKAFNTVGVWAELNDDEKGNKEEAKKTKQSLFGSVTEALDFSQVRSPEDAQLLEEAREATKSGGKMSREQYGALRRKIGGTYKDFFKSYIEGSPFLVLLQTLMAGPVSIGQVWDPCCSPCKYNKNSVLTYTGLKLQSVSAHFSKFGSGPEFEAKSKNNLMVGQDSGPDASC